MIKPERYLDRIKILLIADGRDAHTQRWARYFADRSHEVHLVTYDPVGFPIEGVAEHVLTSPVKNLYLAFWIYHFQILRLVRAIQPNIIHAHFIAKYGFHLPFLFFHPSVVSAWGDDILILPRKSILLRFFTGKVLRYADHIYAVSKDLKTHIELDFRIPDCRVSYVPIGVDTGMFSPAVGGRLSRNDRITVFSNRKFFPVYDIPTLITGFSMAHRQNPALRLVLRGEGPEEERIKKLVTVLGLDPSVTFLKRTEYTDIPEDLRQADIFISTALSDGTPVSLLEAMATGLPCIATSVGGVPEWIENRKNGILILPGDTGGVSDAILELAGDGGLRAKIGSAARKTVVARGEWEMLMENVETDYRLLVKSRTQLQ